MAKCLRSHDLVARMPDDDAFQVEQKLVTAVAEAIADALEDDSVISLEPAARAAIKAMMDWMQADLIEAMERGGYRPQP